MKNQVLKINRIVFLTFVLCALPFSVNAQVLKNVKETRTQRVVGTTNTFEGCETVLSQKSGIVYPLAPAQLKTKSKSNQITIKVKKTGGNAKAIVNIYVNNDLKERMVFNNSNNTILKNKVLNKVKNKRIDIEIVNQDAGKTFQYSASIIGKNTSLTPNFQVIKGAISGQSDELVSVRSSCTGKARILIKRTSGNAPVAIKISYKKNGKNEFQEEFFERTQNTKVFTIHSNYGSGRIEIYMKNKSNSDDFYYRIEADAIQ